MDDIVKDWKLRNARDQSLYNIGLAIQKAGQNLPQPFYSVWLGTLFPLLEGLAQIRRRIKFNLLARSISPKVGFTNNYTLKQVNGHWVAKRISWFSYIKGIVVTMKTGFWTRGIQKTKLSQNDISKFIVESQDFLVHDHVFKSSEFYTNPIKISVYMDKIYVDDEIITKISANKLENVVYQAFFMQQYQTHIMTHMLSTYVYNIFKENKVFKDPLFKDHPLFVCLKELLGDIRLVTDGHGKFDLFSLGGDNSGQFRDTELFSAAVVLSRKYTLLTTNLLDHELVLEKSRQVYRVYEDVVDGYVRDIDLNKLSDMIDMQEGDCQRMLTNVLFMVSYFHTKAHDVIKYLNFDTRVLYILLNQVDLARHVQATNPQPLLLEIQDEIKRLGIGEETYVCNAHKPI